MVTEALMRLFSGLVTGALGLLPSVSPPAWLTSVGTVLGPVFGTASGFSYWVPFGVMGAVAGTVLLVLGVGFGIKVGRIVVSFLTAGGGGAG